MAIRIDKPIYIAEPPVVIDPALHAKLKNPSLPWKLSPEYLQRNQPDVAVAPTAGRVHGEHVISNAVYTPKARPTETPQKDVYVTFKVLSTQDNPISGYNIFANNGAYITNQNGEVKVPVYYGHPLNWKGSTTGWVTENGAKRKKALNNLTPRARRYPAVIQDMTVKVYPESGEDEDMYLL